MYFHLQHYVSKAYLCAKEKKVLVKVGYNLTLSSIPENNTLWKIRIKKPSFQVKIP